MNDPCAEVMEPLTGAYGAVAKANGSESDMISLSHWGMFEVKPPRMIVNFKLSEADRADLNRPDGIIWIDHACDTLRNTPEQVNG